MSAKNETPPTWVLWFYQHGLTAFLVVGLAGLLAIAGTAYWIDSVIDHLEDRIGQQPPQSYSPPDLAEYAAPEIAPERFLADHTLYAPVYSHVYFGGGRPLLLETTLSIRNTSPSRPSYLRSVRYYDTSGQLVNEPVTEPIQLAPLQTIEFVVPQHDSSGGSGANFLVDWIETDDSVEPHVEAVMVGSAGAMGTSFRTTGVPVWATDD